VTLPPSATAPGVVAAVWRVVGVEAASIGELLEKSTVLIQRARTGPEGTVWPVGGSGHVAPGGQNRPWWASCWLVA
jgi:hypothetical protein